MHKRQTVHYNVAICSDYDVHGCAEIADRGIIK